MNAFLTSLSLRQKAEEQAADLPALKISAERAVASVLHGEHMQRKTGSGERFWQFREYRQGDRPQDIDWRQSAKTDRLFIREKEWQTTQTALLWCSRGAGMHFTSAPAYPSKIKAARILTLALALLMTRTGEQIGFLGQGRTGRSEAALQHLGTILTDKTPHNTDELPDAAKIKIPRHTTLFQIGDFLSPPEEIEKTFQSLTTQTTNGFVIQVLDPAELDLPYAGRVLFEGMDGTKERINNVPSIRSAYKQRMEEHINDIRHICRSCHFHYILHPTDHTITSTLAMIWAMMNHHSFEAGGHRA